MENNDDPLTGRCARCNKWWDETDKLIEALRPKPPEPKLEPQMSPGQHAMAVCHVAWAYRYYPHLMQPWLNKERVMSIFDTQQALSVRFPLGTRVLWTDDPAGDGMGDWAGEVTGHRDGTVMVKLDSGGTHSVVPEQLRKLEPLFRRPDDESGYSISDPKHPRFHEIHSG